MKRKAWLLVFGLSSLVFVCIHGFAFENDVDGIAKLIDSALYKQEEFFGSEAIVPIPTAEAYENLLMLSDKNDPKVFLKLAELAEKLEKFDEAERFQIKAGNLEHLAAFYHRRANFAKEAETLEQIFHKQKDLFTFAKLVEIARLHELDKYLQPEFFQQVADESGDAFQIVDELINKLVEDENVPKALTVIRSYKPKFPEKMLEKEVALLSPKEAEDVYYQSFDPFWLDAEAEKFYWFLNENDRFRAYGRELRATFKKNPADFETAIRLIHYKQYDYEEITPIVLQLEKAKKTWSADELLTIARFLLKSGNGDLASKFLYTLHLRQELNPEMRSKISYQIFKILCDSENEKLSLTKGDLSFYRDVATADTHPGITTGILSLVFSDTNPSGQLAEKERVATKMFNRAAVYKVFETHRKKFPEAPELGQMYLDLIGIYTKAKETDLAEKLLNEFEANYERSSDFPRVAMNLADAFLAAGKVEKERQVYRKVLDYLGKKKAFFSSEKVVENEEFETGSTSRNGEKSYQDLLGNQSEKITYQKVLSRYIASLSKEEKIAEILELYSNEIAKYPGQEWLYEERLSWLDQTNMFDEQEKVYQKTLEKFPTTKWRDRIARRFIKQKRNLDFQKFSEDLLAKLNDSEAAEYLEKTVDQQTLGDEMYLKLCEKAYQHFPDNLNLISRLIRFYKSKNRENEWRNLAAKNYFRFPSVRKEFFDELAKKGELPEYLSRANGENVVYELFKADANLHLSRYEEAAASYRKLNESYPNEREFSDRLINLTRSFGQKEKQILTESAELAKKRADFEPSNINFRTHSGEINAELGDYKTAKNEWHKLLEIESGSHENYLETASVFWDYYQYDEALQTIHEFRVKSKNADIYAYEAGAILESQHKRNEAISEYLVALESEDGKAQKRLVELAQKTEVRIKINAIFQTQKSTDWKTLHYAEILRDLGTEKEGVDVLRRQISTSKNSDFLESASEFSVETKPLALKRLSEVAITPRKSISYRLKLADFYRESGRSNDAKEALSNLVKAFPTNYGVLTESADVYWSLGASDEAIQTLKTGFSKAKGSYRFSLASRLAKRLVSLDRMAEAESLLVALHQENPTDSAIFQELARVYVYEENAEKLREKFAETVKAIKSQDIEPKEVDAEIAGMRDEMITAFTRLKDYRSAIEQHIEIINREPENEANVNAAIEYVKRYGGGDLLLNYYQKTADEAFKNYRWNVVLAEIFEANGDAENAVKNYRKAIDNQPEMTELYAELVRIETRRKNYPAALLQLEKIIELSGEDKNILKQKVQLLQLLGRNEEAKLERDKLPLDVQPVIKPENQFSEAEKAKSIEMFRQAFATLLEKPLENDLKGENITSYINILRQEENLNLISERLFTLRQIFIEEAGTENSILAGEARNRLKILDAAMSQTIGNIAKTVGTDEELEGLHTDLSQRIERVSKDEQNNTLAFLQDFSARTGFGDLVEKILIKRGYSADLLAFYSERGAFEKLLEVAERTNNLPLIVENAKLLGNREKELSALRKLYHDKNADRTNVVRYLQLVDSTELASLVTQNSPHQLQLINFLLSKGERKLAQEAIENSAFEKAWKLSRNAETSLALKEFDESGECYFCDALNLGTIGEQITQQPDKTQQLIGDDWFTLSREYGEWLSGSKPQTDAENRRFSDKFLVGLIENKPSDANEQAKLGDYYLAKNDLEKARQHFGLSLEIDEENVNPRAKLSEVQWRLGEKAAAEAALGKIADDSLVIYLETMQRLGLQRQAEERLLPVLIDKMNNDEDIEALIYPVANSFASEKQKAEFFGKLVSHAKGSRIIAEKIIQHELVSKEFRQPFYEKILSGREAEALDYKFGEIARRTFSSEDAEEIYDHENDFAEANRERNEKFTFQYAFLNYLLETNKIVDAKKLVLQIEREMKSKFPRPFSLRLARFQLFGGNLEKVVGIEVTDSVKDVKPPSIERLNEAVTLLKKLNRDAEADKLTLKFYLRMLELDQNDTANFLGSARQYFKIGESEKALQTLNKMIDFNGFGTLKNAAEICLEFRQNEKAIEFRRKIAASLAIDFENEFELAKLLQRDEAVQMLQSIVNERNASRELRWRARMKLYEFGEIMELPNISFDAYSQFYNGNFVNSLIADNASEDQQLQQLIKFYVTSGKPFAALKLFEIYKAEKNDELLDLLSKTAESIHEFQKATDFEKAKTKVDDVRIKELERLESQKNQSVTSFTVDAENTRKL